MGKQYYRTLGALIFFETISITIMSHVPPGDSLREKIRSPAVPVEMPVGAKLKDGKPIKKVPCSWVSCLYSLLLTSNIAINI
jgi:hypothetical protein